LKSRHLGTWEIEIFWIGIGLVIAVDTAVPLLKLSYTSKIRISVCFCKWAPWFYLTPRFLVLFIQTLLLPWTCQDPIFPLENILVPKALSPSPLSILNNYLTIVMMNWNFKTEEAAVKVYFAPGHLVHARLELEWALPVEIGLSKSNPPWRPR
jgi:hypothetical protein